MGDEAGQGQNRERSGAADSPEGLSQSRRNSEDTVSRQNSSESKTAKLVQEKLDIAVGMSMDVAAIARPSIKELKDIRFSLSVADPALPDCPLLMVSDGFYELTGYSNEAVIGKNCRFLNEGCDMDATARAGLQIASQTGRRFVAVIPNRKKDGTLFKNLLEVRGLRVGRMASGQEKILMVGMQADISDICEGEDATRVPKHHEKNMMSMKKVVSKQVTLSLLKSVEGALDGIAEVYDRPSWVKEEVVVPVDAVPTTLSD